MANLTIEQAVEMFKRLAPIIEEQAPKAAETMAITGNSLVTDRIQKQGFGADYSDNEIPTSYFSGKELNAGGTAYIKANSSGTWGKFRSAQGLQNAYVDLTYSGRMFGSITPVQSFKKGMRFHVLMGASDKEEQEKISYNVARYGDFMQPNAEEQKEVDEIAQDFFEDILKKNF